MRRLTETLRVRRLMVKSAGGRVRRRKVPRQIFPTGARVAYQAMLTEMRRTLGDLLETEILPALPGLLAQAAQERGGLRQDATVEELQVLFARLRLLFLQVHPPAKVQETVRGLARELDQKQGIQHQRQMKAAVGIEVVVPEPWRKAVIDDFVASNQDLVTSLTGAALDDFKAITAKGIRAGDRVESIRDQLQARLGITKGKAALLARDQTLRLFGEITAARQKNVGITQYIWSTSLDERVRPRHADLEGTTQSWAEPPIVDVRSGRRGHPGSGDFQCRCQALPLVPAEYLA